MTEIIPNHLKSRSNLEIGGVLFITEDISYTNTLEKRNFNRTQIINGAEIVTRGDFVPIELEATTTLTVPAERPDIFSDAFNELQSDIQPVISPLVGNIQAEITIDYERKAPTAIKVKIHIKQVTEKTNIPGENKFQIPEDILETEEHKAERLKEKESKEDVDYLIDKAKQSKDEE